MSMTVEEIRVAINGDPDLLALAATEHPTVALAELLSVGRTKIVAPRMISERGVRAELTTMEAYEFLKLLKEAAESTGIPAWLSAVLTTVGVPEPAHVAYADALACAHGWLKQDAGLDLGSQAVRDMLDLIAAYNPTTYGSAVVKLKGLAEQPDPVDEMNVRLALWNADGSSAL